MKKILAAIISYNGKNFLPDCINSCKKSGLEILVIDNHSNDGSLEYLLAEKDILLINNTSNRGFTKAANQAIEYAIKHEFNYLLLLNQDTDFGEQMLPLLCNSFVENTMLAIVSPIHKNENSKFEYQFEYMCKTHNIDIYNKIISTIEVPFVSAACWLMDLKKIQETGLLNEIFKIYGSDYDYCNRIISKGYKIGINTKAEIIHKKEDMDYQKSLLKTIKLNNSYFLMLLINPLKKMEFFNFYIRKTKLIVKSIFTLNFKKAMLSFITLVYIAIKLKSIKVIRKNIYTDELFID